MRLIDTPKRVVWKALFALYDTRGTCVQLSSRNWNIASIHWCYVPFTVLSATIVVSLIYFTVCMRERTILYSRQEKKKIFFTDKNNISNFFDYFLMWVKIENYNFAQCFNSINQGIRLTHETENKKLINFSDLLITRNNNELFILCWKIFWTFNPNILRFIRRVFFFILVDKTMILSDGGFLNENF